MREVPEKKVIIMFFATAAIVLFFSWLVIFFLGNKVKQTFENYQKKKLNSLVLEEKRNKILKLERDLPNLEEEKDKLSSMFVKKDASLQFLRTLEKVAGDTSCSIIIEPADISKIKFEKNISSTSKKQESDDLDTTKKQDQSGSAGEKNKKEGDLAALKDYPAFSVEISGRYDSVIHFFDKLENIPFFVRPLTIDITPGEKRNTPTSVTETQASSENENIDEKITKMIMTFSVYGN